MIDEMDEVLRQLMIRELPIRHNEVDIAFDQPKREWSARLSRPTLNLYLHDLRENTKLRAPTPNWHFIERDEVNHTITVKRTELRVDLHYMITAWATEPDDEHRLLARCLMALARFPFLPNEILPDSFRAQPAPIQMLVAQPDILEKPSDLWSVLDNEMRPAINCVLTIALDPYQPVVQPVVRTREVSTGQARQPISNGAELLEESRQPPTWSIGGVVRSAEPLTGAQLYLVERGLDVPLNDGRFAISNLRAGAYTVEVRRPGHEPRRHSITVPAADYDLEI